MPDLNWSRFLDLPGSRERNFEQLCRAAVRIRWGQYGDFVARANQPGVEFHLKLHTACDLGEAGRWYGWQCKWWDTASGRTIGKTRKENVEEGIALAEKHVPGLTDWVLVTRRPLTKGDQEWFYGLKTHLRLSLIASDDIETWLTAPAELLLETYFGDLILTPDRLAPIHERSAAEVGDRWIPDVHQIVDAEATIRRMLGEEQTSGDLQSVAQSIGVFADEVSKRSSDLDDSTKAETEVLVRGGHEDAARLIATVEAMSAGDLDAVANILESPPASPVEVPLVLRRLRARNHQASVPLTNLIALRREGALLLDDVSAALTTPAVLVIAEAGCGKTQLSAQLSGASSSRPPGLLLYGNYLGAHQSLDELAARIVIDGKPVQSFEAMVAALDAAGQRSGARLPLVIDGLNEAEDPRNWKSLLASALTVVNKYNHVLLVCTVRGEYVKEAVPASLDARVEIPDFGGDTLQAIRRYFQHYKIKATDVPVPVDLLSHPLTLRIYCEVANPRREEPVGVESMPHALSPIFARYMTRAAERIAETSPINHRYREKDVLDACDAIALKMWKSGARSLGQNAAAKIIGDKHRTWEVSLLRALEQDGIVLRQTGHDGGGQTVSFIYDALAGHAVATALVNRRGSQGVAAMLKKPKKAARLGAAIGDRHPLAQDILGALASVLPQAHGPQLWEVIEPSLRSRALRLAANLEARLLDEKTVVELADHIGELAATGRDLFARLRETRGAATHPLNARFLDQVLRSMPIAVRDLRWTEWLRTDYAAHKADIDRLRDKWRAAGARDSVDDLQARWVMWTLTSTIRNTRDEATRALYWYGRGNPAGLFALAIESLTIDDPYVPERVAAAAYGLAMANQVTDQTFGEPFAEYLKGLHSAVLAPASCPTNHALTRHYIAGTFEFAKFYYPDCLPDGVSFPPSFAAAASPPLLVQPSPDLDEAERSMQMDFENYTLGRLFDDRQNYDSDHAGHRAAKTFVATRIWDLGWRTERFEKIDQRIGELAYQRYPSVEGKVDRYGKKYSWIGAQECASQLDPTDDALRGERFEVDIDPSFPERLERSAAGVRTWARTTGQDEYWLRRGPIDLPEDLVRPSAIGGSDGLWILVNGYMSAKDSKTGRSTFGFVSALLVDSDKVDAITAYLREGVLGGRGLVPEPPAAYYTFAGEIPWSDHFATLESAMTDLAEMYTATESVEGDEPVTIEILAHSYAWESHHSSANDGIDATVPSKSFSKAASLKSLPQHFAQVDTEGNKASISLIAPRGFDGHLLYLREDLVRAYAQDRAIVRLAWGERQLYSSWRQTTPKAAQKIYQRRQNVWNSIQIL